MKDLDTYLDLCTQVYELSKPKAPEEAYTFYKSYLQSMKANALEPMCGTGRFLLPLLQDGFEVQGFDASQNMLNALHKKAKAKKLSPNVWHGYVEDINLDDTYNLIFIPSGSFGLLIDEIVSECALKNFHTILEDDGVFVFESETLKAVPNEFGISRSSAYKRQDGDIIVATFFDLPPENNVRTSICRYELVQNNQVTKTEIEEFKVRIYDPAQLTLKLKGAGFSNVKLCKAFDRDSGPDNNDKSIVYECRK